MTSVWTRSDRVALQFQAKRSTLPWWEGRKSRTCSTVRDFRGVSHPRGTLPTDVILSGAAAHHSSFAHLSGGIRRTHSRVARSASAPPQCHPEARPHRARLRAALRRAEGSTRRAPGPGRGSATDADQPIDLTFCCHLVRLPRRASLVRG